MTQWVLVREGLPERHYTAASVAARDFKKAAKCAKKQLRAEWNYYTFQLFLVINGRWTAAAESLGLQPSSD